jgi:hypothetical protein
MREGIRTVNDWLATEYSRKCCQNLIYLQCKGKTISTWSLLRTENWSHQRSPKLKRAILASVDAFREALEMRRSADKSYFLQDE